MDATLPRGSSTKPVADHIYPVSAPGGLDVARELGEAAYEVMCSSCNSSKGGKLPGELSARDNQRPWDGTTEDLARYDCAGFENGNW